MRSSKNGCRTNLSLAIRSRSADNQAGYENRDFLQAIFCNFAEVARTFELEGAKAPLKVKTRSFGEFRLTAIRQNHRINKGCRTKPSPTANFCPLVQRQDS